MGIVSRSIVTDVLEALLREFNGHITKENIEPRSLDDSVFAPGLGGLVPAGAVVGFAGASAPEGWLLCDGSAISRSTYDSLFAAIGTTYGAGDGSTTFNLPDLRGRVPVGVDGAAGRLTASDALGNSSGAEKHLLTSAESGLQDHNHLGWALPVPTAGAVANAVNFAQAGGTGFPLANSGGADAAQSHNNMQPYQVVNYIVKA